MGDHDDRTAVVGQLAQRLHDVLVHARVEPGGGLVQVEQGGFGQQLERDAGALALPTRQPGHLGAGVLGEPELHEDLVHPGAAFLLGRVRREPQLGAELEGPPHGQGGVEQVLLGHVTDAAAQLVVLGVHVPTGVAHLALVGRAEPGEGVEQGGLARATRPDHRQQRAPTQPEGHVVHELFLAGPHVQTVGLEADVPGVDVLDELVADKLEHMVTDGNHRALRYRLTDDALAVDERAVRGLEIGDLHIAGVGPAVTDEQLRMPAGSQQVTHDDVVVAGPPDGHPAGVQRVGRLAFVLTLKVGSTGVIRTPRGLPGQMRSGLDAGGAAQHRRHLEMRILVLGGSLAGGGHLRQDDDLRSGRGTEPEADLAVHVHALHPLAVEPGSVRADVPHGPARADRFDQQVPAGHPTVGHDEVGRAGTPDDERLAGRHGGHDGAADDSEGRLHVFPPSGRDTGRMPRRTTSTWIVRSCGSSES